MRVHKTCPTRFETTFRRLLRNKLHKPREMVINTIGLQLHCQIHISLRFALEVVNKLDLLKAAENLFGRVILIYFLYVVEN